MKIVSARTSSISLALVVCLIGQPTLNAAQAIGTQHPFNPSSLYSDIYSSQALVRSMDWFIYAMRKRAPLFAKGAAGALVLGGLSSVAQAGTYQARVFSGLHSPMLLLAGIVGVTVVSMVAGTFARALSPAPETDAEVLEMARNFYRIKQKLFDYYVAGSASYYEQAYHDLVQIEGELRRFLVQKVDGSLSQREKLKLAVQRIFLEDEFKGLEKFTPVTEILYVACPALSEEQQVALEYAADELTRTHIDLPSEREVVRKLLINSSHPLTLSRLIPSSIPAQQPNDEDIAHFHASLTIISAVETHQLMALVQAVPDRPEKRELLFNTTVSTSEHEASWRHEAIHFMASLGILPIASRNEVIPSMMDGAHTVMYEGMAGLRKQGDGANAALFQRGRELFIRGGSIRDLGALLPIIQETLKQHAQSSPRLELQSEAAQQDHVQTVIEDHSTTGADSSLERAIGYLADGFLFEKNVTSEMRSPVDSRQPLHALVHEPGRFIDRDALLHDIFAFMRQVVAFQIPRQINPSHIQRAQGYLNAMRKQIIPLFKDASLRFEPWQSAFPGDLPAWRYLVDFKTGQPKHIFQYVPSDLIYRDERSRNGFIFMQIFRAYYSFRLLPEVLREDVHLWSVWNQLEQLRVLPAGLDAYQGVKPAIERVYEDRFAGVSEKAEIEVFQTLPLYVQFMDAVQYEGWNKDKKDPRVIDARVREALDKTADARLKMIQAKTADEGLQIVRDEIYPVIQDLITISLQQLQEEHQVIEEIAKQILQQLEQQHSQGAGGAQLPNGMQPLFEPQDDSLPEPGHESRASQSRLGDSVGGQAQTLKQVVEHLQEMLRQAQNTETLAQQAQTSARQLSEQQTAEAQLQLTSQLAGQSGELHHQLQQIQGQSGDAASQIQSLAQQQPSMRPLHAKVAATHSKAQSALNEQSHALNMLAQKLQQEAAANSPAQSETVNSIREQAQQAEQRAADLKTSVSDLLERAQLAEQQAGAASKEEGVPENSNVSDLKIRSIPQTPQPATPMPSPEVPRSDEDRMHSIPNFEPDVTTPEAIAAGNEKTQRFIQNRRELSQQQRATLAHYLAPLRQAIRLLRSYIRIQFQGIWSAGMEGGHETGFLDLTHLVDAVVADTPQIYLQPGPPKIPDVLFSLLVDGSYSMLKDADGDVSRAIKMKTAGGNELTHNDIHQTRLGYTAQGMTVFLESLHEESGVPLPGFRSELVVFSDHDAFPEVGWTLVKSVKDRWDRSKLAEVLDAALNLPHEGTQDYTAIRDTLERGKQFGPHKHVVVVLSDGESTEGLAEKIGQLRADYPSAKIIGVGIGPSAKEIADTYGPTGVVVDDISQVPAAIKGILQNECKSVAQGWIKTASFRSGATTVALQLFLMVGLYLLFYALLPGSHHAEVFAMAPIIRLDWAKKAIETITKFSEETSDKRQAYEQLYDLVSAGLGGETFVGSGGDHVPDVPIYALPQNLEILREMETTSRHDRNRLVYLWGPQGSGKNYLLDLFAAMRNQNITLISAHRDMTVHDIFERQVIKTRPGPGGFPLRETVWELNDFALAMMRGEIGVWDEFLEMPNQVKAALNDALQSRQITRRNGEVIPFHKDALVMATSNPPSAMSHTDATTAEVVSRFKSIEVDYLDETSEIKFLNTHAPSVPQDVIRKIVLVAQDIRNAWKTGSPEGMEPVSTRELVMLVEHLEMFPDDLVRVPHVFNQIYLPPDDQLDQHRFVESSLQSRGLTNAARPPLKASDWKIEDGVLDIGGVQCPLRAGKSHIPKQILTEAQKQPENLARLQDLLKSVLLRQHILIEGEAGTGKDWAIDTLLGALEHPVYKESINENTHASHLVGAWGLKESSLVWDPGKLQLAVEGDGILNLSEINRGKPGTLATLYNFMENGRISLGATNDQRRILDARDKENFMIVATKNPDRVPYSFYPMPPAMRSRFKKFYFDFLPEKQEVDMFSGDYPTVPKPVVEKLIKAVNLLRAEHRKDSSVFRYQFGGRLIEQILEDLKIDPTKYQGEGAIQSFIRAYGAISAGFDVAEAANAQITKVLTSKEIGFDKLELYMPLGLDDSPLDVLIGRLQVSAREGDQTQLSQIAKEIQAIVFPSDVHTGVISDAQREAVKFIAEHTHPEKHQKIILGALEYPQPKEAPKGSARASPSATRGSQGKLDQLIAERDKLRQILLGTRIRIDGELAVVIGVDPSIRYIKSSDNDPHQAVIVTLTPSEYSTTEIVPPNPRGSYKLTFGDKVDYHGPETGNKVKTGTILDASLGHFAIIFYEKLSDHPYLLGHYLGIPYGTPGLIASNAPYAQEIPPADLLIQLQKLDQHIAELTASSKASVAQANLPDDWLDALRMAWGAVRYRLVSPEPMYSIVTNTLMRSLVFLTENDKMSDVDPRKMWTRPSAETMIRLSSTITEAMKENYPNLTVVAEPAGLGIAFPEEMEEWGKENLFNALTKWLMGQIASWIEQYPSSVKQETLETLLLSKQILFDVLLGSRIRMDNKTAIIVEASTYLIYAELENLSDKNSATVSRRVMPYEYKDLMLLPNEKANDPALEIGSKVQLTLNDGKKVDGTVVGHSAINGYQIAYYDLNGSRSASMIDVPEHKVSTVITLSKVSAAPPDVFKLLVALDEKIEIAQAILVRQIKQMLVMGKKDEASKLFAQIASIPHPEPLEFLKAMFDAEFLLPLTHLQVGDCFLNQLSGTAQSQTPVLYEVVEVNQSSGKVVLEVLGQGENSRISLQWNSVMSQYNRIIKNEELEILKQKNSEQGQTVDEKPADWLDALRMAWVAVRNRIKSQYMASSATSLPTSIGIPFWNFPTNMSDFDPRKFLTMPSVETITRLSDMMVESMRGQFPDAAIASGEDGFGIASSVLDGPSAENLFLALETWLADQIAKRVETASVDFDRLEDDRVTLAAIDRMRFLLATCSLRSFNGTQGLCLWSANDTRVVDSTVDEQQLRMRIEELLAQARDRFNDVNGLIEILQVKQGDDIQMVGLGGDFAQSGIEQQVREKLNNWLDGKQYEVSERYPIEVWAQPGNFSLAQQLFFAGAWGYGVDGELHFKSDEYPRLYLEHRQGGWSIEVHNKGADDELFTSLSISAASTNKIVINYREAENASGASISQQLEQPPFVWMNWDDGQSRLNIILTDEATVLIPEQHRKGENRLYEWAIISKAEADSQGIVFVEKSETVPFISGVEWAGRLARVLSPESLVSLVARRQELFNSLLGARISVEGGTAVVISTLGELTYLTEVETDGTNSKKFSLTPSQYSRTRLMIGGKDPDLNFDVGDKVTVNLQDGNTAAGTVVGFTQANGYEIICYPTVSSDSAHNGHMERVPLDQLNRIKSFNSPAPPEDVFTQLSALEEQIKISQAAARNHLKLLLAAGKLEEASQLFRAVLSAADLAGASFTRSAADPAGLSLVYQTFNALPSDAADPPKVGDYLVSASLGFDSYSALKLYRVENVNGLTIEVSEITDTRKSSIHNFEWDTSHKKWRRIVTAEEIEAALQKQKTPSPLAQVAKSGVVEAIDQILPFVSDRIINVFCIDPRSLKAWTLWTSVANSYLIDDEFSDLLISLFEELRSGVLVANGQNWEIVWDSFTDMAGLHGPKNWTRNETKLDELGGQMVEWLRERRARERETTPFDGLSEDETFQKVSDLLTPRTFKRDGFQPDVSFQIDGNTVYQIVDGQLKTPGLTVSGALGLFERLAAIVTPAQGYNVEDAAWVRGIYEDLLFVSERETIIPDGSYTATCAVLEQLRWVSTNGKWLGFKFDGQQITVNVFNPNNEVDSTKSFTLTRAEQRDSAALLERILNLNDTLNSDGLDIIRRLLGREKNTPAKSFSDQPSDQGSLLAQALERAIQFLESAEAGEDLMTWVQAYIERQQGWKAVNTGQFRVSIEDGKFVLTSQDMVPDTYEMGRSSQSDSDPIALLNEFVSIQKDPYTLAQPEKQEVLSKIDIVWRALQKTADPTTVLEAPTVSQFNLNFNGAWGGIEIKNKSKAGGWDIKLNDNLILMWSATSTEFSAKVGSVVAIKSSFGKFGSSPLINIHWQSPLLDGSSLFTFVFADDAVNNSNFPKTREGITSDGVRWRILSESEWKAEQAALKISSGQGQTTFNELLIPVMAIVASSFMFAGFAAPVVGVSLAYLTGVFLSGLGGWKLWSAMRGRPTAVVPRPVQFAA